MIMLMEDRRDERRAADRNDRATGRDWAAARRLAADLLSRILTGTDGPHPLAGAWAGIPG